MNGFTTKTPRCISSTLFEMVHAFEELKTIGKKGVDRWNGPVCTIPILKGIYSPFSHFVKWANGEVKEPTATFIILQIIRKIDDKNTPAEKKSVVEAAYINGLNACVKEAVQLTIRFFTFLPNHSHLLLYIGYLNDIEIGSWSNSGKPARCFFLMLPSCSIR